MKTEAMSIYEWQGSNDSGCDFSHDYGSDYYYVSPSSSHLKLPLAGSNRRAGSLARIPAALQTLALEAVLQQLLALCQQRNYADNKRALKHYLKFQLPDPLRQQLLDLSLKEGRIYTLVDLNIFELLLSASVSEVSIRSIRPFFRQPLVAILRQLGTGIEALVLEDSSWLDQSRDSLTSALATMNRLQELTLHYIANDAMIAAVAVYCPQLQLLDVTSSTSVTDKGIGVLCRPPRPSQLKQTSDEESVAIADVQCDSKRLRKLSAPAQIAQIAAGSMARMVRGIRRRHSIIQQGLGVSSASYPSCKVTSVSEEDHDEALLWPDLQSQSQSASNPVIIRSIRQIILTGTQVTDAGLQLLYQTFANVSVLT